LPKKLWLDIIISCAAITFGAKMIDDEIIGREKEKEVLDQVWKSKEAEFVAIYGRRRVGKTYLVQSYFSQKDVGTYLEASGAKDKPLRTQLNNFMKALSKAFFKGITLATPKSWDEAFDILTKELEDLPLSKAVFLSISRVFKKGYLQHKTLKSSALRKMACSMMNSTTCFIRSLNRLKSTYASSARL
jgi:AAA+ ATPase superfamily predicted ATPase